MTTAFEKRLLSVPIADWQVGQIVVFDWYDGPREGICKLVHPQCCFYFASLEEQTAEDDLEDCSFRLNEVPADAVEQAVTILEELGPPTKPTWVPIWKFPSEDARLNAEHKLDVLLAHQQKTSLIVQTPDMIHFLRCKQMLPQP